MSQHPAARFPALVKSARQALGDGTQLDKLKGEADKPGSWWQISYNAACAEANSIAVPSEPADGVGGRELTNEEKQQARKENQATAGRALNFLEQTLVRPGVEQLSAGWVSRDPDLAVLGDCPRFRRFLSQLRPGE
jgi:hypothetical protein